MTIHYNNQQNYNVECYVLWCRGDINSILYKKKKHNTYVNILFTKGNKLYYILNFHS